MSEIFVKNVSDLRLPRIVAREKQGRGDLAPGEIARLADGVEDEKRFQIWVEKGYVKEVEKEVFERSFYLRSDLESEENTTYKAKVTVERGEDGSTILVPGLDDLPESDEIPDPVVENLDGTIGVRAPADSEPLEERSGDKDEAPDIRPRVLTHDGKLIDTTIQDSNDSKNSEEATDSEQASVGEVQKSATTTTFENGDDASTDATAILNMKAWRQQVKALEQHKNNKQLIQTVKEQTKRNVVAKKCDELLKS